MPISSAGIGSGLDVASIISQLMTIESQPLVSLQNKQVEYTSKISAYGQLRSSIAEFQSAMEQLNTIESLEKFSTSSTSESVITASAESGAVTGSYGIEVVRQADFHKMSSNEAVNSATFGGVAGDSIAVQVGVSASDTVTIDLTTAMTLSQIRDAINDDVDNPGVTATIISGVGSNQKLVLTADTTGEASALTISYGGTVDLGLATINDIAGDLSLLDSEINVDGYNITRSTNSINDVISGVTLNLLGDDPGNTHTIAINRDTSAITNLVQAFSDAYDSLRAEIKIQRLGELGSDSALLSIERQLTDVLNTSAKGGSFKYLTEVGVTMQKDGTMSLDTAELQTALESDFEGVTQLFGAEDQGFAARFYTRAESWLASDGLLASRTDGLNARISDLLDKQISIERNLVIIEERYRAQFSALDTLIGNIQSTSDFLTSQLANLPGFKFDRNK